jgi:predicted DCC family thiol-disulfide oxidoreductase YuxK
MSPDGLTSSQGITESRDASRCRGGALSDDRLVVYVDADCGLCNFAAIWLARLDILSRLRFVALQAAQSREDVPPQHRLLETIHARDATGRWWIGASAFLQVARRVPALWSFALIGRVPAMERLMEGAYRRIARDRGRLSARLGLDACRLPPDAHA